MWIRSLSRVRTRVRRPLVLTAIDEDSTLKKEGKRDRICSASESTLVRTTQGLDNQHVMAIITCPGLSSATVACTSSQEATRRSDRLTTSIETAEPTQSEEPAEPAERITETEADQDDHAMESSTKMCCRVSHPSKSTTSSLSWPKARRKVAKRHGKSPQPRALSRETISRRRASPPTELSPPTAPTNMRPTPGTMPRPNAPESTQVPSTATNHWGKTVRSPLRDNRGLEGGSVTSE